MVATRVAEVTDSLTRPEHRTSRADRRAARRDGRRTARAQHQRGHRLLVVLVWITGIVGVVGAVVLSLLAGETEGSTLALVFAAIPLPLLWLSFWWLDRVEPEPRRYIWAAFLWGAVIAVALSIGFELLAAKVLDLGDDAMAAIAAPVIEETAKGLFLLLTFWRARRIIDGVLDGIIVAGVVALGFATIENILYYAGTYSEVLDGTFAPELPDITASEAATMTFVLRGVFSPLAHPLFTSALGIAFGLAVARRSKTAKTAIVLTGLVVSMALHALWNGSIVLFGGAGLAVAYLTLMAYLIGLLVVAIILRQRQVRTVQQALAHVALRGWLHPDEVPYLASFHHRRAARKHAKKVRGRATARAVRNYQRLATELAFEYDHVMRGVAPADGVQRTYAVLDAMWRLRPDIHLPPPLYARQGPAFAQIPQPGPPPPPAG